jgi:diguanylate cyclase (GGDEF)-like protein/PAS domain S-box-containing protein
MENEKTLTSHLSTIIESSGAGTWEWNVQTGATRFNATWAAIVGYTLEELAPISIKTWEQLSHPDDLSESARQLQLHFDGHEPTYRCDARMRHKKGHWVWVRDTGRVISWTADGKPEWMVGMHFDITAEKQAEQHARTTEQNLRRVIDSSPTTIFVWDLDTDELHLYGERVELLHDSDEIITNASLWWQESIHPVDGKTMVPKLQEWIKSCSDQPLSRRYRIRGANSQYYWLQERMRPVIEAGRMKQAIGSIINVTESVNLTERLEALSNSIPGMIYDYRWYPDGRSSFPYASEGVRLIYGCSPEDIRNDASLVFKRIHPDDVERVTESVFKSADEQSVWEAEYRVILPEVGEKWVSGRATPIRLPDGGTSWHGVIFDVTAEKKLELELEQKQITLERAQEIGELGYWTSQLGFDALYWSNKIYDILGLEPNSVIPSVEAFRDFVHPEDREFFDKSLAAAEATGTYNIEHRIVRADGQLRWVHELASFCKINNEDYFVGTMRDITQAKEYQAQLEELSETDELTKLYNRRYFMSQAKLAYYHLERFNHPTTLVLIDIDHFKKINDEFGHDVGDVVLKTLANYLKQAVRPSDVVARLGGEEFVLLLHQTELYRSLPRLEEILKGINELEVKTKDTQISVSATFGVTEIKPEDVDVSVSLIRADQALYEGKRKGRNQIVVNLAKY